MRKYFFMGLGCSTGLIIFLFIMMGVFYCSTGNMDKAYNDVESVSEGEQEEVRYFNVRSKKGKANIHTGMSKDSVIILLGEPMEFMSDGIIDNITYRYGNHDLNVLKIDFEKGKVKGVYQY